MFNQSIAHCEATSPPQGYLQEQGKLSGPKNFVGASELWSRPTQCMDINPGRAGFWQLPGGLGTQALMVKKLQKQCRAFGKASLKYLSAESVLKSGCKLQIALWQKKYFRDLMILCDIKKNKNKLYLSLDML